MRTELLLPQVNTVGLVAHWKLWAGFTGTSTAFDYSLNGNTGTVSGSSCLPKFPGFNFDGTEDHIQVADSASLDVSAVTISAWVYLDSTWSAAGYIVAKMEDWAAGGEVSYALQIAANRKPALGISNDGNAKTVETASNAISKSVWHYIVGTYEYVGSTAYYKLYVDGSLVASDGSGSAAGTIYTGTGRLAIGARYDSGDTAYKSFFNGYLDDVMILNIVKSAAEIRSIYEITRWRYAV